jgi:hypothetical protein
MASHWPFGHLEPKLWAKEGPGVKLAVWLPTTKNRESTSCQHPIWECNTSLKRSRRGLQLWLRPRRDSTLHGSDLVAIRLYMVQTSSQSDSTVGSYELPKSWDSTRNNFGTISGLQLGSPEKKSHLDVASAESCREYYKGDGGGFPQVRAVLCLVVWSARG